MAGTKSYFVTNPSATTTHLGRTSFGPFDDKAAALALATRISRPGKTVEVYDAEKINTVKNDGPVVE